MKALGEVLGRSKSGFLIVRSSSVPPLRAPVVNSELVEIGVVGDVFGPVERPYVSIRPKESASVSPGTRVYVLTPEDRRLERWRSPRKQESRRRS